VILAGAEVPALRAEHVAVAFTIAVVILAGAEVPALPACALIVPPSLRL